MSETMVTALLLPCLRQLIVHRRMSRRMVEEHKGLCSLEVHGTTTVARSSLRLMET